MARAHVSIYIWKTVGGVSAIFGGISYILPTNVAQTPLRHRPSVLSQEALIHEYLLS